MGGHGARSASRPFPSTMKDDPESGGSCWTDVLSPSAIKVEPAAIAHTTSGSVYVRRKSSPPPVDEDDAILTVAEAHLLQSEPFKETLYWSGVVLTCGLLWFLTSWLPNVHAALRYVPARDPEDAEYVAIRGLDGVWSLQAVCAVCVSDSGSGCESWAPVKDVKGAVRRARSPRSRQWDYLEWWWWPLTYVWNGVSDGVCGGGGGGKGGRSGDNAQKIKGAKKSPLKKEMEGSWWFGGSGSRGGGLIGDDDEEDPEESTPLVGGSPPRKGEQCVHVFEWRQERFWLDGATQTWHRVRYDAYTSYADLHAMAVASLEAAHDEQQQLKRVRAFGRNRIHVPRESFVQLFGQEMTTPFVLFQLFSVVLWLFEEYYLYTCILGVMTLGVVTASALETQKNQQQLERIATYETQVRVARRTGGDVRCESVSSADLLPGDIVQVTAGLVCPSDLVLLTGSAVVNEAMLTGESAPVPKESLPVRRDQSLGLTSTDAKHILLCGTKVLAAKCPAVAPFEASQPHAPPSLWTTTTPHTTDGPACLAMVVHTSYNTAKGKLVRGILYPQVKSRAASKRERDVALYVAALTMVMVVCVVWYAIYGAEGGLDDFTLATRCLDIVTILVPPALPLALTIGIGIAAHRLARRKIYSTSPQHIASAGHVDTVCYDKTGTLTSSVDKVYGVVTPSYSSAAGLCLPSTPPTASAAAILALCPPEQADTGHVAPSQAALWCISAAHSLGSLQQQQQQGGDGDVSSGILGDPLDIAMFTFSRARMSTRPGLGDADQRLWSDERVPAFADSLIVPAGGHAVLVPVRRMEFDPEVRMMTTLALALPEPTRDSDGGGKLVLLTKGAPESVARACDASTLPTNLEDRLRELALEGRRVLGLAYKVLQDQGGQSAMAAPRGDLESQMVFCGLLVVGNDLKHDTRQTLAHIADAGLRQVMLTGDNPLTALAVAKECGPKAFISPGLPSIVIDKAPDRLYHTAEAELCALDVARGVWLDGVELEHVHWDRYNVAVTGAAFQQALRWEADGWHGKKPLLMTKAEMLCHATVFARFNPKEKQQVVRAMQDDMRRSVAMVGDGANDSFALKQADAGMSIAAEMVALHHDDDDARTHGDTAGSTRVVTPDDKEAAVPSIAAHFSTPHDSISSLLTLLCEGRGALASAMVALRYMIDYGFIQCTAIIILYVYNTDLSDDQFLWGDFFNVLVLLLCLDVTPSAHTLHAGIPESDLLSLRGFLGGTILHITLLVGSQVIMHLLLVSMPWYTSASSSEALSYNQTVAFYASSVQYVIAAAALAHTYGGFRQSIVWSNIPLLASIVVLTAANVALFMGDWEWAHDVFNTVTLPVSFRFVLLAYTVILGGLMMLLEGFILRHAVPIPRLAPPHHDDEEENLARSSAAAAAAKGAGRD